MQGGHWGVPSRRFFSLTALPIRICTRRRKARRTPLIFLRMTKSLSTMTAVGRDLDPRIRTNRQGEVLYEARYWFLPALEDAGISDFVWYGLRHTAASRWVMNGVPIPVVSKYLGHSNVNQTMVYSHLQPDNAAQAIAAMMSYYPSTRLTLEN